MKKVFCTVVLTFCFSYLLAQHNYRIETKVYKDEYFVLDSACNQRMNYEFLASDSIILDENFYRQPWHSTNYCTMDFSINELAVFPPEFGLFGGPNTGDSAYVGALDGTIDIGTMGGANYTIPIELPSGLNGMQPSLSLVYNSQGGNGLIGWKWDLAGLSSITRTGRTRYHDGSVGGVTLDDQTDRFIFDGQRLIKLYDSVNYIEYKTEQDNMARIRAYREHGNGLSYIGSFKVWKADGTILEYGSTEDSRVLAQDEPHNVICWFINKQSDRNGNAIDYIYNTNQQTGECYIQKILYTNNELLGIKPEFSVDFIYSDVERFDYDFRYIGGCLLQQKKDLEQIRVSKTEGAIQLLQYTFEYETNENHLDYGAVQMRHRIKKILYSKGSKTINPTCINWTSSGESNVMQHWNIDDTTIYNNFPFVGDFNADGYSDLVVVPFKGDTMYYNGNVNPYFFLNNKDHGFMPANINIETLPNTLDWIHVLDINDDGYDDLVTVCYDSLSNLGRTEIMIYLNKRSQGGILFDPVWEQPLYFTSKVKTAVGDFLGQGKRSMLVFGINANGDAVNRVVYVPCNNGSWCHTHAVDLDSGVTLPAHQIESGEYFGDGRTELFVLGETCSNIWKLVSTNNGYLLTKIFDVPEIQYSNNYGRSQVFSGDFNGDGLTDLLSYRRIGGINNGENIWNMHFSKTNGFDTYGPCIDFRYFTMPKQELYGNSLRKIRTVEKDTWNSVCVSDFDGDGTADVAVIINSVGYSYLNLYFKYRKENHKFLTIFQGSSYNGQHYYDYPINCRTQYMHVGFFLDKESFSFLGLRKVVDNSVPHLNTLPRLYSLKSVGELNNVKSITDGLGNTINMHYGILIEKFRNYEFGVRTQTVPIRVLAESETYNAAEKPVATIYDFTGLCFHRDGHGFLGFRQIVKTEKNNGIILCKTKKMYSLDVMKQYAMLLPNREETYVYPISNDSSVISSIAKYYFTNVVNTMDTLVICPALTSKNLRKFNVDLPGSSLISKEITEYYYNFISGNNGQPPSYTYSYDCVETRTGLHGTNVNEIADCEFRTRDTCTYDIIHPDNWILGRLTKQVTTQSKTDKEDKVRTVLYTYDSNDSYQISSKMDIPNTPLSQDRLTIRTDYRYYPTGNLQAEFVNAPYSTLNEPTRATIYEYGVGNLGRLITKETVNAGGLEYETAYAYDEYDNLDTVVDKNGLVTAYDTDPLSITSLVNNPDGTVIGQALRWSEGHPLSPNNASYYSWSRSTGQSKQLIFYHKSGKPLRTVTFSPQGKPIIADILYNDNGLAEAESNPYYEGEPIQWTTYKYDRLERLAFIIAPDETQTEIVHEGLVTRTHVSDNNGNEHKTKRTDNAAGWTVSNRDPKHITVNYDYYADGSLAYTQVGDNIASRISISYDSRGNRDSLTDPDYGLSTFLYDAYGNLIERTSPKFDVTSYRYDAFGRMIWRHISGENDTTTFLYDEAEGLKGTLKSIAHGSQIRQYRYDQYLRPVTISEELFGTNYETQLMYDCASRVRQMEYPTGVTVQNEYSLYGHLVAVKDAAGKPLWEAGQTNAMGQLLQSTMGGNIVTNRQFDNKMHHITSIVTSNNLQNLSYGYDKFGNLARRTDSIHTMTEAFGYDQLNRLTDIDFGVNHCKIQYDNLGRMVSKQAILWKYGGPHVQTVFSTPQFDGVKIHALTDASAHPDWFATDQLSVIYTSFDKVSQANMGNHNVRFQYGFDEERVRMRESHGTLERQKIFVSGCEFIVESNANNTIEKSWTFLTNPVGVFAVVEKQNDDETIHYILNDHQGSWTVIADSVGNVEQELSYDAWGNLRSPETWCVDTTIRPMFDRGYTGHEHLIGFRLINMNGRMYDPVISSFLSVDRYVQQPENSQGFNRYAYCMYNPLKYVDPSGWMMTRPNGRGGIPPYFAPNAQPVSVNGGYQLAVIDGMLYGGCLIDTYAIDNAISSSGSTPLDKKPYFSSDRGFGNFDWERDTPSFNPTGNHGGGGGGVIGLGSNNQSENSSLISSVLNSSIVPEMHKVYNTIFTFDGIVYLNPSKSVQVDAGQHIRVEIKNINEIGVVLSIQDASTYHYTKTLLGLPKTMYTGESHSFWLFPGNSISYDFYRFDYVPITWLFEISTNSDAASVRVIFYSEWHNGMSPDPNHPKYKNRP